MKKRNKYKATTIKNMKFIDSDELYQRFIDPKSMLVMMHDNIDFSFVNDICEGIYSDDGQKAYLPEMVFKVIFLQFYKGGLSDNEIVRQCKTNMEYRYFCDLAIDDELFDDCKLSRFRKELGEANFKQIFDRVVEKIKAAGFITNEDVQYMDSYLMLADVKVISINALLVKAIQQVLEVLDKTDMAVSEEAKRRDFELSDNEQKKRFVFLVEKAQQIMASARKETLSPEAIKAIKILKRIVKERAEVNDRGIRKKESEEEKDKIISVSDPDARMMGKKNTPIAPSYKGHVSMNKGGFITCTGVSFATKYDGHYSRIMVTDMKQRDFTVPAVVGDTHYGDMALRKEMAEQGTQIIAPYRKNQVMNSCLTEDVMIEAWAYNHTWEYRAHKRIRSHIEPKQGEMKNLHGMKRAKYRTLSKVSIQNYVSAIVTNCKLWMAS